MTTPLPTSSSIPGAVSNLLTIATSALPADTTVWYGAALPAYSAPLTFQITEINGDQSPAEIGLQYRREETFAVVCNLTAYVGGSPDFNSMLTSLMDNFALLSTAIGDNPTLNGAVRYAQVGNFIISADTDTQGQAVQQLDFQVRCQQRIISLSTS